MTLTLNAWAVQQISPFVCCAKLQAKNARHAHLFGRHAQADGHPVTFCCDFVSGNRIVYVARPRVVT